jgi:hypothetical protein
MNIYQEVSNLLTTAELVGHEAQIQKGRKKSFLYKNRQEYINEAIKADPIGWWLDNWNGEDTICGITYRGCWWFHVVMPELPNDILRIVEHRNVNWLIKDEGYHANETKKYKSTLRYSRDIWQSLQGLGQGSAVSGTSSTIRCRCGKIPNIRSFGNLCFECAYTERV